MPIVQSTFSPPPGLRGGHLQTILPVIWRRHVANPWEAERLELADSDFLDLSWVRQGHVRLAILSHGLEGGMESGYIQGMAQALRHAGWDVLAWCFRGCSGEANRLLRAYHSGETEDLGSVVKHAAPRYEKIALVGFSLGGNVTLKYMGEAPPHPAVVAAVGVSAPVDLASSAALLDHPANRLYRQRFLTTLVRKMEAKALLFPGEVNVEGIERLRTFREFDDRFTAPLHGFADAADYWKRASSRQFIPGINVPTLLLNARNDPLLGEGCFPFAEAEANPCFFLEAPASGGHVGFLDFRRGREPWYERRVVGFLDL